MEKAIKIAIENGYKKVFYGEHFIENLNRKAICLDPLFWQAVCAEKSGNLLVINPVKTMKVWHRFIDHLADGGDINSFFEERII